MKPREGLGKENVFSILNRIRYSTLDFYLDSNTIVDLHKKYQGDKIDSKLNKYSKYGN